MDRTVVVVDDDPVVRAILEAVLSGGGYRVVTAADADEATRAVRQVQPAAVVVDRMLAGRDGVDLCREMRADGGLVTQPSVILLTADADRVSPELAASAGIDAVLAKPCGPAELLEHLAAAMSRRA